MNTISIRHADNYRLDTLRKTLQQSFADIGLPEENPFGAFVKPGDNVFIKPNWVASRWRESCPHKDDLYCVITHPNVVEVIADFTAEALDGRGSIIIGDNPSIDADFEELMNYTKLRRLEKKYDGLLTIKDLRPLVCDDLKNYGKRDLMIAQRGDDQGTVEVNLGRDSLLYGIDPQRFRGVFDERDETVASHTGDRQLYNFSRSLYDADVYISIPKLKTHQKVGATLNLKGLVGTIGNKNQLVHWQVGYPEVGGDEYPSKEAWIEGSRAKVKHRGAWPGNDTIWRMVVDLYNGFRRRERKYFSVVDGITAGEGQGPFCPTSKNANTLIVGNDLFDVDCVAVRYMGLNPNKIKYLDHFLRGSEPELTVKDNGATIRNFFGSADRYLDFYVSERWNVIKIN